MDFSVRTNQAPHHAGAIGTKPTSAGSTVPPAQQVNTHHRGNQSGSRVLRVITVILLFSVTILLIAIAFSIYYGASAETKLVNTKDFQVVDVAGSGLAAPNQVYYGAIKTITDKYVVLNNVYYALPGSTATKLTIAPLSCQTGKPYDQVIINRPSLNWWENLQPSGAVTTDITNYVKANPSSQPCPAAPTTVSS